jgi:hypothetical protein
MFNKEGYKPLINSKKNYNSSQSIQRKSSTFKIVLTNELFKENFTDIIVHDFNKIQFKYFDINEGKQYNLIKTWPETYSNQTNMDILSIMWVKQHKENKITDRYIIKGKRGESELFAVSDVFYIDNIYIIKFLGMYAEVEKLANVNFKHQGTIEAQTITTNLVNIPVYAIPETISFLKRANPFYFWLELFGV